MQKLQDIDSFKDKYERFSNFYPVLITFESIVYPTIEHAFVASKSLDLMFRADIAALPADKAGKAKRMGRNKKKCKLRKNWELIKVPHMERFLTQKFSIYEFRQLLLSTGTTLMIEGNYWHDNYWGNCYCPDCKNIKGINKLGKLLMKKRDRMSPLRE